MLNSNKLDNIEDIFKELHKIPELSYEEVETTKFIKEYLKDYDLEIYELDPTGLICVIDKGQEETLAFRTDLDALPILEKTDFEYKSGNDGVMHACGHDGHISMLLKFIYNIYKKKLDFSLNLMFIFQPAEELNGGANLVLKSEIFKKYEPKKIFGMHLWPEIKSGVVGIKDGALMGTNLPFDITIKGKSAHVCTPQNGIDATLVFSELIQSINYIIAKYKDPFDPVVINIGKVNGGTAGNIIIGELNLSGTIRAASDETLQRVELAMKNIFKSLELKYSCIIEFVQTEMSYPVVYNDEKIVREVIKVLNNKDSVKSLDYTIVKNPTLASEDFGFYAQKYKSVFFFLGTNSNEHPNMLHTSNFSFDLNILNKGVELYEILLERFGS